MTTATTNRLRDNVRFRSENNGPSKWTATAALQVGARNLARCSPRFICIIQTNYPKNGIDGSIFTFSVVSIRAPSISAIIL
jgi:hypothetical protein